MSRTKPVIKKIEDLDQANEALKEIALCELKLKEIDADALKKITRIKEEAERIGKDDRETIAALGNALAVFGEYEKTDLFKKKRTLSLTFGDIGFRKSSKISVKKTTIDLLKKFKFNEAIRTKETIDKDELKKWPKEKLTQVGAKLKEEDTFFYETKKDKLNEEMVRTA